MSSIFDLFRQIETSPKTNTGNISHMVVGLGNPGDKYKTTRHNTGFMAVDGIAAELGVKLEKVKFKSLCADSDFGSKRVLFMKPQTFMNNSGEAVKEAAGFYKIPPENIIIIFDDINFDVGEMRIKRKGSDGGHNGIKSIAAHLGSGDFPRVKIGVGKKPTPEYDLKDFVLGSYSAGDLQKLDEVFKKTISAVEIILSGNIEKAMNLYNR